MGMSARSSRVGNRPKRDEQGQMTVELAVTMPVLIIVAVIAVNACTFFYHCAVFDRISHGAARVYAASPAYGEGPEQACASIEQTLRTQLDAPNLEVDVAYSQVGADFDEFRATLSYQPTLFGLGLRSEVFGVALPTLEHTSVYVVDSYKPGVVA